MVMARPEIRLVKVRCSNCGADDAAPIGLGPDHEYRTVAGEFQMVRCRCGLVYMNPRPDTGALDVIYPPNYYAYELAKKRARGGVTDSRLADFMARRAVARLAPYVARVKGAASAPYKVLDIGCGDGSVLSEWARALAAPVQTEGVEMNAAAAAVARAAGHRVHVARVEEARLQPASFDLVYSFHVIEHVEDPVAFLTAARAAVRPCGLVLVDTPNVDTLDFRLFSGGSWGAYHFPRHFTLYDPRTITALAHVTGFEVEEIRFVPSAIFWIWTLHALLEARAPRVGDALFPPVEIYTHASPWNVALLAAFTTVDRLLIKTTGRCAQMRVLLRPKG